MGPEIVTLITAALTSAGTLFGTLQAVGHRSRKEQRRAAARVDQLEAWVYKTRHAARRFNDRLPCDTTPFDTPALPDWMTDAADE